MTRRFLSWILCLIFAIIPAAAHTDPIHDAASQGDLKRITALVKADPAVVQAVDKDGATPLHFASAKGTAAIVKFLIEHKADVDAKKKGGVTPLHVAAGVNSIEAVKALVAAKADTNAVDDLGRTPLSIAQERGYKAIVAFLQKNAKPPVVWTLDIRDFNQQERLAAVCLQGIANRETAQVYLNTGPSVRWMGLDNYVAPPTTGGETTPKITSVCDLWIKEFTDRKLYTFQLVTLDQLIVKMRSKLKGVILYQDVYDDLAVVATMAGLRDAVPMTSAVYSKWVAGRGLELPIVFDVSTIYKEYNPKYSRHLESHRWAVKNLFPQCEKTGAISRDRTYGLDEHDTLIDIDLGVQNRWITYNLSYLSSEARENTNKPDPVYGFDPPDKPILTEILSGLQRFCAVYGWGTEGEYCVLRRLNAQNCVLVCTGDGNSSFYKHLPLISKSFAQPSAHKEIALEQKTYVAFLVNEGDTLKCLASLQNQACWTQPERGKIPINWGMDSLLYQEFPGLTSYYYATATPNDYFFAAVGGWGYVHPDGLPESSLTPYAELLKRASKSADLHYVDFWWVAGVQNRNLFFPFAKATGMSGVTNWSDHQGVEYSPLDGMPIVQSNFYYPSLKQPAQFAAGLIEASKSATPPWFIVIYGGTPHEFYEVAKNLPTDRFKVVTLDEFFEAARQARSQVEGRVWKPK